MVTTVKQFTSSPAVSRLVAALGIIVATLAICLPGISTFHGVSLYDEITHFDNAYKIGVEHRIPADIEPLSEVALEEWACRPGTWQMNPDQLCNLAQDGNASHDGFPVEGLNYNGFHPPLYYAVTGAGGSILSSLTGQTLFVSMRVMSALWLAGGAVAFFLVAARWLRSTLLGCSATLLLVSLPPVASFGMMINPDATAVLAGTIAVWSLLLVVRGNRRAPLLIGLAAFLVAGLKLLLVAPLLVALVILGLRALTVAGSDAAGRRVSLLSLPAGMVGVAASALINRALTASSGLANPVAGLSTTPVGESSPLAILIGTVGENYSLLTPYWLPEGHEGVAWTASTNLVEVLVVAAPLIIIWAGRPRTPEFALATVTITSALALPLAIQAREILTSDAYFQTLATRYSLVVIPLAIMCVALAVRQLPAPKTIMCGLATVTFVSALVSIVD